MLKNAHLWRCPHPSPCQAQGRLIAAYIGRERFQTVPYIGFRAPSIWGFLSILHKDDFSGTLSVKVIRGDPTVDNTESVGKYLKKEREARNLSLGEVAKKTRISEQILNAIEEDQYDLLPPATYVKGFLSAYARSLGVDPNDVVLRFQSHQEEKPVLPPEPPPEKRITSTAKHRWVIPVVLGGILIGLVLIYLKLPISTPPIQPLPPKPLIKPEPQESPPAALPQTDAPILPEGEPPFSLQFKAVEETWVRIQINGQTDKEMILKPGDTTSYQALERIQLRVGNAGGLDLVFNGKTLEKFGKSGEVVNLVFTPKGVEANPPEKPNPSPE